MLGNFILKLVFFLTRGSYSITLLSCNSDAQANDNVNSDVKVSTLNPTVFHGSIINLWRFVTSNYNLALCKNCLKGLKI